MEKFIKAVKSLLADIDDMRDKNPELGDWYGPFSEWVTPSDSAHIEWPNLSISAKDVTDALAELEVRQSK